MDNIYENDKYSVVLTDDAIGEDGQYGRTGYAVVNKETGVIEHTTTVLPQALFQADAFMGALGQMGNSQSDEMAIIQASPDDILPN
jgi:hypothetical protein